MANWKDHMSWAKTGACKLAAGIKLKNRRAAMINRLRTVIRCQERAAEKEYLALGRYYYNALRDRDNPVAEEHCAELDKIQALLDSTLGSLEQAVEELGCSCSVKVIGGADGPTAVCTLEEPEKKEGTLFHFNRGPLEITVTRDSVYHPGEGDSEEIDLSDVESFDHDPMPEVSSEPECSLPAEPECSLPAELDENDGLPFEG